MQMGGKWGTIDNAKAVLKPEFEAVIPLDATRAAVKKEGKWALVDAAGKTVAALPYDGVGTFGEELLSVSKEGKVGFVDASGKEVIAPALSERGRLLGRAVPGAGGREVGVR